MMQAINAALLNVNWETTDNQQMKLAVLEHVDAELACEITKGGTEVENWKEMLTRVMEEFLMIDKTKGLARAAKRRSVQDQEGRDSKRQAKGGYASSELESNWKWTASQHREWERAQARELERAQAAKDKKEDEKSEPSATPGADGTSNGPAPVNGSGCDYCYEQHFVRNCPYLSPDQRAEREKFQDRAKGKYGGKNGIGKNGGKGGGNNKGKGDGKGKGKWGK